MSSHLRDIFNESNSFWFGFFAGALFLWILAKSRKYLSALWKIIKRSLTAVREYFSTGTENHFRMAVTQYSQRQHLSACMFSLDEVIVEPMLMVPPMTLSSDSHSLIDTINLTIPYIPDIPELGATYQTPITSIFKAIKNGANLVLAGNPGSGKTVALAYLASQIARKAEVVGDMANLLPVFIHAVDLNYTPEALQKNTPTMENAGTISGDERNENADLIITTIVEALSKQISGIKLPRLPNLIQSALDSHRVIILLDGLDELPPDRINPVNEFIKTFINQYPKIQIIASVSYDDMGGFPSLGFQIMAMAAWGEREKSEFIRKWGGLWDKSIVNIAQEQTTQRVNQYLPSWLSAHDLPCIPLDLTLKVWAAYAGDILGSDTPSALEAYLRRLAGNDSKTRELLERFALQIVVTMNPALQPRQSDTIPISYDSKQAQPITLEQTNESLPEPQKIKLHQVPAELVNLGLLHTHSQSRFRFANPILTGYLAGKALISYSGLNRIQEQPAWSGKTTTLYFYSHFGDAAHIIQYLLKNDDFLRREQLRLAGWLRVAPKNRPWRSLIFRTLVSALHAEKNTLSLAARIITTIATSGDPGVSVLFRQLLQSENANLQQLAALACGMIKDSKAINDLLKLLTNKSPSIVRSASLALVAIGDKQALEIIADALLHGNETMRRSAAEALANHPLEGYPTLQDGSTHNDLRVRHAVVYGLMRIQQPWAVQIINHIQMEEKEWIVRTAAIQAMEELSHPTMNIPKPLPDLSETPWLADFAAKQGVVVAPGKPAYDLVIEALKKGNSEERLQALAYLSIYGDETSTPVIYSWYFGGSGEIRDAAYQTLWYLASSGKPLPQPEKYGFSQ